MAQHKIVLKTLQYLFYPIFLAIAFLATVALINSLNQSHYVFIPLLLSMGAVVILVVFEKALPYNNPWNENRGDFKTDLIQTFLTLPIASKLGELILPVLMYFPLAWLSKGVGNGLLGVDFPLLPGFLITLVASEFIFYWIHRWSHNSEKLWQFHAVHHGSERLYWANAGRFHIVDAFLGGLSYTLPIFIFGISPETIVLLITFSAISGFMEHTNINFKSGILNYIFNTAEVHRWHHSEKMEESNNNFGKVLVVWDLIFGTYYRPKNKNVKAVGIQGEVIPNNFKGQWQYPFRQLSAR